MKKHLLLISSGLLLAFASNAQITITTADVSAINTTIRQANDSMATVSVGNSGTSQTWNLTGLNSHTEDTLFFMPPNWTPAPTAFPTANVAVKLNQQGNDAFIYAINNASGLSFLGNRVAIDLGTGTPIVITQRNTPAEIQANFPSTYNSNFTNNYVTRALDTVMQTINTPFGPFFIDSIMMVSHVSKTSTCDGWGTVTTPLSGTGFNALRFETIKINTDTVWAYLSAFGMWTEIQTTLDTTKTYTWWANGAGFPLAEVTVDYYTDIAKTATWLKVAPTVGVNEYANAMDVTVYPNPAQNILYISAKAEKVNSIQLFDITGKLINTISITNDISTIDVSAYANGLYNYSVIGKDQSILSRGKFTVAK
jgi:hypothetical protein